MPKVSIIIPVYNAEKYLNQCLESLCNQTLTDFEVVCINDGSTDSSLEILQDFASKDSRFIIIDKKNEGQGVARNIAIKQAKGEYLLCLDSDDWLETDALEKAYNKIKIDNTDILFFDVYNYSEKNKKKYLYNYSGIYKNFKNKPFTPNDAGKILFQTNGLPFKMYRTKFLQNNNIEYSSHKFIEDAPFYIKSMLCAEKISCLPAPIYNYRVSLKSATYNYKNYFECIPEVYDICFDIIKTFKPQNDILQSFLENRIKSLLHFYSHTPIYQKNKYFNMMKKIIKKHFLQYGLDKNLQQIYSMNSFEYQLRTNFEKTKIVLKSNI